MKKGLLLSIVASTMIFAGGDIAPVEPAAAAPAADCSDFYGSVGAYYQTVKDGDPAKGGLADKMFDKANSNFNVTAVIGVEKALFGGLGFGAEVAGWSRITNDIAMHDRVGSTAATDKDGGELSQLFLTASFGNTAAKFGRFALPTSLSPLMRTGTTAGVKDTTYDGLLVANTDLADTTVYGVWAYRYGNGGDFTKIGKTGDEVGAFALGMQYKGFAGTTVTAVGYYAPDFDGVDKDLMAGALTVNTTYDAYGVDAQVTYLDEDTGPDATITAGLRVKGSFDMFDAWATVAWQNDGGYNATIVGGTGGIIGDDTDMALKANSEAIGVAAGIKAKVGIGSLYGTVGYVSYEDYAGTTDKTHTFAVIGYKATVSGIALKAEYKYWKNEETVGGATTDPDNGRVRLEASYKF